MKNFILLIITFGIALTISAQVTKTVNVTTAGTLSSLASPYLTTVTNLTVTGSLNAKDFKCIHDDMTKLTALDISDVTIKAYSGNDGTLKMNTTYPVNEIPTSSFQFKSTLTTCVLPNSATSIGTGAFSFSGLTFIMIGDSYTSIGGSAFSGCRSLVEIYVQDTNPNYSTINGVLFNKDQTTLIQCPIIGLPGAYSIPNSVTSIERGAFSQCAGLTSLTIPSSVITIGDGAFGSCSRLTSVTIPNGVTSIGRDTFYHCSKISSITIPNTVTSIGDDAFRDCLELINITIPNGVTSIGEAAFLSCVKLNSVIIPNGVTSIKSSTFHDCSGLTSVIIPNIVTSIGSSAFYGCTGLTNISIPSGVTSIEMNTFFGCKGLTSVTIPDLTKSIGIQAFDGCSGLTSIKIPNKVTSIGLSAFSNCSGLTSVSIGNSVTSIGNYAFFNCIGLTSIYANPISPVNLSSQLSTFSYVNTNTCNLFVPLGSKNAYQAAYQWKDFKNIIELATNSESLTQSNIRIITENGKLIIKNTESGGKVQIYTIAGVKIKEQQLERDQTTIYLAPGIYVLCIGNYSDKLVIK